jgi:hypothetical protein
MDRPAKPLGNRISILLLLIFAQHGFSQSFVNLNFEQATIVAGPGGRGVVASNAIPGWTAYTDGLPQTVIAYNTISLGGALISIHDTKDLALPPLQGVYSVNIQGSDPGITSAAIGQTGQIPTDAQSLTFWAQLGSLQITFNGQVILYNPIGTGPNYVIYGGDISQFAGQTGQLVFAALPRTYGFLDNIQFSTQPIPEPSGLALFGLGTLLLSFFRFTARRSACGWRQLPASEKPDTVSHCRNRCCGSSGR